MVMNSVSKRRYKTSPRHIRCGMQNKPYRSSWCPVLSFSHLAVGSLLLPELQPRRWIGSSPKWVNGGLLTIPGLTILMNH